MQEFKHVKAGDPLAWQARTYNAMVDAANDYAKRSAGGVASGSLGAPYAPLVIPCKNTGVEDLTPWSAVSFNDPLIDPSESEQARLRFKSRPAARITGLSATDKGPIGVTLNTIEADRVGPVIIGGVAFAEVDLLSTEDDIARNHASETGIFQGQVQGRTGARILTKPDGQTGKQWCLLQVGDYRSRYASVYRVELAATLVSTDASVSVDSFQAYNGINNTELTTATAFNVFNLAGSDDDTGLVQWCDELDRWELTMVAC